MIGNNELRVNEATMIAAAQLWINCITQGDEIKVTGVEQINDPVNGKTFSIKVDGGEKK
jgi:hypothetical protein